MKFYETKNFHELQKEWNEKLSNSGFKDVENGNNLKDYSYNLAKSDKYKRIEERRAYFEAISNYFNQEVFLEYEIIKQYVEGKKRTDIYRDLISRGISIEYETVRYIVRRYEYKWGIKNYSAKQMGLRRPPSRY